ncbi:MAG TPA: protein kinase [Pyrinomonadaceae bacterium]|jgi:serine/threonine protein kinase
MLAKNEVLQGRYRIIRQLGQGGMGAIYVAEDSKRFGKLVALKEILLDLAKISNPKQRESVRRAFEREAKILTQLEHDAFPQVVDYFLEINRQFLVMELIQGEDLGELLEKSQNPFPLKDVLKWTEQMLDAIDYLHTLKLPIIHRDIKPQNIKLTAKGKIKLLDFGIAKGQETQGGIPITNQTFIGATLHYSPIEQLFRVIDQNYREFILEKFTARAEIVFIQNADSRSDLYALGATLYHLLTAHLPVDALKRALAVWAGKPDPLPNPQQVNPQIPAEISEWLLKSTAIERENRFASAAEMQKALDEIISGGKRREEEENRRKWLKELEREREERKNLETTQLIHQKQIEEKILSPEADIQNPIAGQSFLTNVEIGETQASITAPSITQSPPEIKVIVDESDINFSGEYLQKTDSPLPPMTEPSYLPENFCDSVTENPSLSVFSQKKSLSAPESKKSAVWIWPTAVILLLMFGGVGLAAFLMFRPSLEPPANKTNTNSAVSSSAAAPTLEPSASPPAASTKNSPAPNISGDEKPKPTVAPTSSKTPQIQNPAKKTLPTRNTPKPLPVKNSDCIFNGAC